MKYKIYSDGYAGSDVLIIEVDTGYVARRIDTWNLTKHGAIMAAKLWIMAQPEADVEQTIAKGEGR